MTKRGFTLIEILVVVSIIGLLSTTLLAPLSDAKKKALTAKLKSDALSIEAQIDTVRKDDLGLVTGNWCTACAFDTTQKISSQPSALVTNAATWTKLGFSRPPVDPWGNPYTIDENEGEMQGELCRYDMVYSAGPGEILYGFLASGVGDISRPDLVYHTLGFEYPIYGFGLTFWSCTGPN